MLRVPVVGIVAVIAMHELLQRRDAALLRLEQALEMLARVDEPLRAHGARFVEQHRIRQLADLVREAELLRVQANLASRDQGIKRRERALEDAERLKDRETALPTLPYVSFSEGLDAFTGSRPRSN